MKRFIRWLFYPLFFSFYVIALVMLWLFWMILDDNEETFEGNKS